MEQPTATRTRRRRVALVTLALLAGVLPLTPAAAQSTTTYRVPAGVSANCSKDATRPLLEWIARVPDGSTLQFGRNACYRIDGSLSIDGRHGLVFNGNNATFRAVADGDRNRRHFWFLGGSNLLVRNLTVRGANRHAGTGDAAYRADREFQHAFALQGVQGALLDNVAAYDVYGDFVYVGPGGSVARREPSRWSRDVTIRNSRFARNGRQGIAITAAENVLVTGNSIDQVRRAIFDLEPARPEWGARRIRIERNTTGASRLLWLAAAGLGGNISDIRVAGNVMTAPSGVPLIEVRSPQGTVRGPFLVEGNTFVVAGSPAPAFRFSGADGVTIRNNTAVFAANRQMTAVGLHRSHAVAVSGNTFAGAAKVCYAVEGSEPCAGTGNLLGP